jgi:di/tripeptidase
MVILAISCSNNKTPKGVLTEKEITPIIVDLHLAEAIYTQRYTLANKRENFQEDLYLSILKKYKLDQKAFEASVLYYGKHPDKYKPIYDEVLNRLNEMNVKARIKDSIDSRKPVVKPIIKDTLARKDTIGTKNPL